LEWKIHAFAIRVRTRVNDVLCIDNIVAIPQILLRTDLLAAVLICSPAAGQGTRGDTTSRSSSNRCLFTGSNIFHGWHIVDPPFTCAQGTAGGVPFGRNNFGTRGVESGIGDPTVSLIGDTESFAITVSMLERGTN
jgi:hypothetical protein